MLIQPLLDVQTRYPPLGQIPWRLDVSDEYRNLRSADPHLACMSVLENEKLHGTQAAILGGGTCSQSTMR